MSVTNSGQSWGSWSTDTNLNGATVAAGATSSASLTYTLPTASPSETADIAFGVAITYGATITGGGATVYICADVDGTNFESTSACYMAFMMPVTTSATIRRRIVIPGVDINKCQVFVSNPATNSTITVTLTSQQSQIQSG